MKLSNERLRVELVDIELLFDANIASRVGSIKCKWVAVMPVMQKLRKVECLP